MPAQSWVLLLLLLPLGQLQRWLDEALVDLPPRPQVLLQLLVLLLRQLQLHGLLELALHR
jgi:hypothetical protein